MPICKLVLCIVVDVDVAAVGIIVLAAAAAVSAYNSTAAPRQHEVNLQLIAKSKAGNAQTP